MGKDILDIGGFTILGRLGNGARSTIYRAKDDEDGSIVALKRVVLERPEDIRVFEQTESEYKIAKKIDHPYIRKCFKLKKIKSLFRVRELLLSMEIFDGQTLEECPSLSLGDVLLIFRMVATGLNAIHQNGFVHCDIKPNNILLNKSGSIKIIDLGQSCRIGTTKSRIQGTPDYIAPEQVKRQPLGPRTDIFNLGATMYWALTGKNIPTLIPTKNNGVGLLEKKECPPPHELKPLIPRHVSELVMACVQENPSDRPRDMTEVVSNLDDMIQEIFGERIKVKKNVPSCN
jgi:serine/threonine protein kinase